MIERAVLSQRRTRSSSGKEDKDGGRKAVRGDKRQQGIEYRAPGTENDAGGLVPGNVIKKHRNENNNSNKV